MTLILPLAGSVTRAWSPLGIHVTKRGAPWPASVPEALKLSPLPTRSEIVLEPGVVPRMFCVTTASVERLEKPEPYVAYVKPPMAQADTAWLAAIESKPLT